MTTQAYQLGKKLTKRSVLKQVFQRVDYRHASRADRMEGYNMLQWNGVEINPRGELSYMDENQVQFHILDLITVNENNKRGCGEMWFNIDKNMVELWDGNNRQPLLTNPVFTSNYGL